MSIKANNLRHFVRLPAKIFSESLTQRMSGMFALFGVQTELQERIVSLVLLCRVNCAG